MLSKFSMLSTDAAGTLRARHGEKSITDLTVIQKLGEQALGLADLTPSRWILALQQP